MTSDDVKMSNYMLMMHYKLLVKQVQGSVALVTCIINDKTCLIHIIVICDIQPSWQVTDLLMNEREKLTIDPSAICYSNYFLDLIRKCVKHYFVTTVSVCKCMSIPSKAGTLSTSIVLLQIFGSIRETLHGLVHSYTFQLT